MKRRIGQIDLDTGELLGEYVTVAPRKKRLHQCEATWMKWFLRSFGVLKMFKRISDVRVLCAMLEKIDYENNIVVNQALIAQDLDMHRSQVSASIKRLMEVGIFTKNIKHGVHISYKLNPNYGWMGSEEARLKAVREQGANSKKITLVQPTEETKPAE